MQYKLEQVVPKRKEIYRQVYRYYDYCEHVRSMSQVTLTSKIYTINNFLRTLKIGRLEDITDQMVYDWLGAQRERGNTGRSINDRLAHVKAMLRWQQEMNVTIPNLHLALLTKMNEEPPRKVYFTRADIGIVLTQADEIEWLLIRLAFDCGLRIGELQRLRLEHLNHDRLMIIGKGNKRRYVYLCEEVKNRLQQWLDNNYIKDYFWPSPVNLHTPLNSCTLRSYMKRAFARSGYYDFCPHDLRHSYATDLKFLGIPTRQIQAGLGHATEAVTERYLSDLEGFDLRQIYQIKYATSLT